MTTHKLRTPVSRCTSHRPRPRITFIASVSSKRAACGHIRVLRVCETHHRKHEVPSGDARWPEETKNSVPASARYTANKIVANRKEVAPEINFGTVFRTEASYVTDFGRNFWRGHRLAN